MALPLIEELLTGDSAIIRDIARNEAILVGFLTLAKGIDDLQDMDMRFYEDPRSLYQVTSSGRSIDALMEMLSDFFGKPAKPAGRNLPVALRFDPVVRYLGGIRKDQALFLKKLKTGAFYGALWPWQREAEKIEILLGFHSPDMNDDDGRQLEQLVKKFLSKKKIEAVSGVGGQIHGISLPSFLQMSEMEGATYTLNVTSGERRGYLFLDGGSLIGAQLEGVSGNQAAYRIISWDNVAIQIEAADPDRAREIHEPLMHVMMESLKIKDEAGAEPPPAPAADAPSARPVAAPTAPRLSAAAPPSAKTAVLPSPAEDPSYAVAAAVSDVEPPVIKPFEKVTDRSADKQRRMKRGIKLLIAAGLAVVLAGVFVFGAKLLEQRQAHRRYERLMADLATAGALDAQIVLLMQYLKTNPADDHRSELEARLNEATIEIEKRDYEKTLADVDRLTIDAHYENKALSLYTAFLSRYPHSAYAAQVEAALAGIRKTLAAAFFDELQAMAEADPESRYRACREYLTRFPQGAERGAVERLIVDLTEADYRTLESAAAACDARKNWDDCLARCDRFLTAYEDVPALKRAEMLRSTLQDKKDLAALSIAAELAGDDLAAAKRVFTDYLKERPQTTQQAVIRQRIGALDAEIAEQVAWEKTKAYATDGAHDIFSRLAQVDAYRQNQAAGRYVALADQLKKALEPEREAAIQAQRQAEAQQRALARRQAAHAQQAREARRIRELREQTSRQLQEVAGRFVDNADGTVTDRFTGLTWCLLDSYRELGRCISYKAAKAYVRGLTVGDHTDWRLPAAGELAAIYKQSPFFPDSGADWYWTSESFARGYHRVVDVVTAVPETVFSRSSKSEEACGSVRAVRR